MKIQNIWKNHLVNYFLYPKAKQGKCHRTRIAKRKLKFSTDPTQVLFSISFWLVVEPTHLKTMLAKLNHFPRVRNKNKKSLKPPTKFLLGSFLKIFIQTKICSNISKWHCTSGKHKHLDRPGPDRQFAFCYRGQFQKKYHIPWGSKGNPPRPHFFKK